MITILIVDDRPENILVLKSILAPSPYRLLEAGSGREALQVLLRERVHLVLLDVVMPDMDGFEVAGHIKQIERTKHIPIIFMTAIATDVQQFDRAYDIGAVDYLTKPLDRELVKRRVAIFAELVEQREMIERQQASLRESDRREHELQVAELRVASDRRYRRLVEGFDNAIGWTMDDRGSLSFISRQASRYLGTGVDELRRPSFFLDRVHPHDRAAVEAMLARCRAERREMSCTHRMIAADCRDVWLFTCVSCEMGEGGRFEIHGLSTDITGLKQAEATQNLLADLGALLVQSFDLEAHVLPSVARRIVRSHADWCVIDEVFENGEVRSLAAAHTDGRDLSSLLQTTRVCDRNTGLGRVVDGGPAEMRASVRDPKWMAHATGIDLSVIEALGAESCLFIPISVREGRHAAMTLVSSSRRRFQAPDLDAASEVASRIALAVESVHQYRTARRAIRAREDLLSVVSHDLRTPLTAITTGARLLENGAKKAGDDRGVAVVGAVLRATQRMERLIGDLLDVAQIDAGQLRIVPRDVSGTEIVEEVVHSFSPRAKEKNVKLEATCAPLIVLSCDRDRIVQVLSNLVGNALKFTPPEGTVAIAVDVIDDSVRFAVNDTGPGIAQDQLGEIWKRFWRCDHSSGGGVGLGLSIAKSLVEAHDGRIWAESKIGAGSIFFFTLPAGGAATRFLSREGPTLSTPA